MVDKAFATGRRQISVTVGYQTRDTCDELAPMMESGSDPHA